MSQNLIKDEMIDVVDQYDQVVRFQSRIEVYDKGLEENRYTRFVNVLLYNSDGQLLLPKRSADSLICPGCYDFSCGEYLGTQEPYNRAVIRGLSEKLGLLNPGLEVLGKLGPEAGVSGFMNIYKVVADIEKFDYEKAGIQSIEWLDPEDVLSMIKENPISFNPDFIPVFERFCQS